MAVSIDAAAFRHGVARVDDEVDDGVFELARIGEGRPKAAAEDRLDCDRFANRPRHHVRQTADEPIHVHLPGIEHLLT